jgi:hypothetical protein
VLTISEIGSTFRFCDSPEGVMEQEGEHLVALTTVATYGWEGNLMVLRTADGATAVLLAPRTPVDLPEPETAAPWGRVTAPRGVNVRSGPGTNSPVLGFVLYGDEGPIVGRSADGNWWATVLPSEPDGHHQRVGTGGNTGPAAHCGPDRRAGSPGGHPLGGDPVQQLLARAGEPSSRHPHDGRVRERRLTAR